MRERDETILDDIAAYNRDDCVSTLLLRDWLEVRRVEAIDAFPEADWSRPTMGDGGHTRLQGDRAPEGQATEAARTGGTRRGRC